MGAEPGQAMTVAGRAIVGALQFSPSVLIGDGQWPGLVLAQVVLRPRREEFST